MYAERGHEMGLHVNSAQHEELLANHSSSIGIYAQHLQVGPAAC